MNKSLRRILAWMAGQKMSETSLIIAIYHTLILLRQDIIYFQMNDSQKYIVCNYASILPSLLVLMFLKVKVVLMQKLGLYICNSGLV